MQINKTNAREVVETEPGRRRRLIHTDSLMVVEWEFAGPWKEPDPPHAHPHEQVTYLVAGEILFFLGDEGRRLRAGDMVAVPPDAAHCIQVLSQRVRLIDAFTPLRQEFL
ncbi:MAG: cupin domain-containing protein [Desulfosarcinaceae bacterium]|nr:cupin domain-containing protein [Desulfosarcinaceae bacterium]